ncbi:MAG: hypothetical protein AB7H88_00165 [Vicinamibacterales bacterium]
MDGLAADEYRVLRETIAARGSLRVTLLVAGVAAWAVVLVLVLAWVPNPVASAIPLVLLVATFEAMRGLHAGVERIGRYLQVFHEPAGPAAAPPAWERTAMAFGPSLPGAGGHPLFVPVLLVATAANYLAVLLPGPLPIELAALAVPHAAFVAWMLVADRAARRQRATELARFQELKQSK